jgi:hypothetical protein
VLSCCSDFHLDENNARSLSKVDLTQFQSSGNLSAKFASNGRKRFGKTIGRASLNGSGGVRPNCEGLLVVESAALFGVSRERALMAAARARMRALLLARAWRSSGEVTLEMSPLK